MSVDVVIVGCGPVGAATAVLLAHRGLTVTVVERETDIYHLPRAVNMDEEVRRVFQNLGLEQRLAPLLTAVPGAEFVDAERNHLVGWEMPNGHIGPLGYPRMSMYHQPSLDRFLRAVAAERGVEIVLGHEVTGLTDTADGVRVSVAGGLDIEARWAIGCDGAASFVRSIRGIDVDDLCFDQDWLVVDVLRTSDVELPRLAQQVCDRARPATFVPGHEDWLRFEFQLQPGETRDDMEDSESVWKLLEPWLSADDGDLARAVVYRFHAVVAKAMRDGPVFFAGDVAHQMPPFLGQGLMSGIRDGANLSWKLDLVNRDAAGDALLDSYDAERRPHAAAVVDHAADVGRLIDTLAGRAEHDVGEDSAYGGGRPFPHLESGVVVGDDKMVGRQLRQPLLDGRRLDELLGDGFSVVATDGAFSVPPLLEAIGATITIVEPGLVGDHAAAIVRPDRYVAAVADSQSELAEAAEQLAARLALNIVS